MLFRKKHQADDKAKPRSLGKHCNPPIDDRGCDDINATTPVELGYQKLEARQVLSATFAFGAGQLLLDAFDPGQDLIFTQEDENIGGVVVDAYLFEVANGSWTGDTSNPFIEVAGANGGFQNQLQVAVSLFGGATNSIISFDGATGSPLNVGLIQLGNQFLTDTLTVSNFSNVDVSLDLSIGGNVVLDNLEVVDSNPGDTITTSSDIDVTASGDINVVGDLNNRMRNTGAEILLSVQGVNRDLSTSATIETAAGAIELQSADSIFMNAGTEIESGERDIRLTSGTDRVVDDDFSQIRMNVGSRLTATAGEVVLDSTTGGNILLDDITTDRLSIFSGDLIRNGVGSQIDIGSGAMQLVSPDEVVLGNQSGDSLVAGSMELSTADAHLEFDSGIELTGINVDQIFFVASTNEIVQRTGDLRATQIGIEAGGFVQLSNVDAVNDRIAISAGSAATIVDPTLFSQLNQLAGIENSEVAASDLHAIALLHRGTTNVGTVTSVAASAEGNTQVSGFTSTDGSQFISAADAVNLDNDIVATSATVDPQVTIYVAGGTSENPNINFGNAEIRVGVAGAVGQNFGVVNQAQTTANFFGPDEFLFRGTTEILVLNPDGSADQDIELEYANAGEAGYRVGVVWDIQNSRGIVEDPNVYVSDVNDPTEAYDDTIYVDNEQTLQQIGGNEGGREVITKVPDYSKENVIAHLDSPNVFSVVTIRNDQHINLFAGDLGSVDNSLNETSLTIRAEFDSPKRFALQLPGISPVNPISVRTEIDPDVTGSSPSDVSTELFERVTAPFETGELKWVEVRIPLKDQETFGDEIRLKDPSRIYPKASEAAPVKLDSNIGENEVEAIIQEIESKRSAEPGFWYKVYKDYKNRDDELFFYHLKTGEVPQSDIGPESDFNDVDSKSDDGERDDLGPMDEAPDTGSDSSSIDSRLLHPLETQDGSAVSPEVASQIGGANSDFADRSVIGVSAASLLMAGLIAQRRKSRKKESASNHHDSNSSAEPSQNDVKFSRFARLKRKRERRLL